MTKPKQPQEYRKLLHRWCELRHVQRTAGLTLAEAEEMARVSEAMAAEEMALPSVTPRVAADYEQLKSIGDLGGTNLGDFRLQAVHIPTIWASQDKPSSEQGTPLPTERGFEMAFDTEKYTKSPFLKGDDLEEGERTVLTIKTAEEQAFPSGDTVPVLSFLEIDQKLTLNKTRVKKLVELLGEDTDEWVGRKIALYPIDVQYNGKTMPGVAVAAPPKGKQGKVKPEVKFEDDGEDDEDSPF